MNLSLDLERWLLQQWAWIRRLRSTEEGWRFPGEFGGFFLFLLFSSLLFSSLLFSSLLFLLDLGPVQMALARVFTTYHWRWSFPVCRIHRKVTLEQYRSVAEFMRLYESGSLLLSYFLYGYGSPVGLQLERGMM